MTDSLPLTIETDRLLLRRWRDSDLKPFAALNSDPIVMEYLPKILSAEESNSLAERIQRYFDDQGFGLWAVEIKNVDPFVGFIGSGIPRFEAHFTPCVEIGWRLAANRWRCGYATEGARAVLDFGFRYLKLDEIVSLTTVCNDRSRRVMERIGMAHSPSDDFEHPALPQDHKLSRHVLYRIKR